MKAKSSLLPGVSGVGFTKLIFYDPTEQYGVLTVRQRFSKFKPTFEFERDGKCRFSLHSSFK